MKSSITKRMQRVHTRMQLERISGIPASEKERFLVLCQANETVASAHGSNVDVPDGDGDEWKDFDKWNDSPVFVLKHRKAAV